MKLWHVAIALIVPLAACAGDDAPEKPNAVAAPATAPVKAVAPVPCTTVAGNKVSTAIEVPKVTPVPEKRIHLDADLTVKRLVIAKGVKSREPVEAGDTFELGERLYAFIEVGNKEQLASEIFISFKRPDSKPSGRIRLRIGESPRWRTWAYTRLANTTGRWEAVVSDANGDVLARRTFDIVDKKPTEVSSGKTAPGTQPKTEAKAAPTDVPNPLTDSGTQTS